MAARELFAELEFTTLQKEFLSAGEPWARRITREAKSAGEAEGAAGDVDARPSAGSGDSRRGDECGGRCSGSDASEDEARRNCALGDGGAGDGAAGGERLRRSTQRGACARLGGADRASCGRAWRASRAAGRSRRCRRRCTM